MIFVGDDIHDDDDDDDDEIQPIPTFFPKKKSEHSSLQSINQNITADKKREKKPVYN
jgi:hypothetical protein